MTQTGSRRSPRLRKGKPSHRVQGLAGGRRLASTVALVLLTTGFVPPGMKEASAATFSVTGVSPASSSGTVGTTQQLTATITPGATLLTGNATVTFNVTSGPNKGLTRSCTVTAGLLGASTCSVSYSSTTAGTDTLVATAGAGDPGAPATVT